jgi:hypothetical protein
MCRTVKQAHTHTLYTVMVVLGTTIHEFASAARFRPEKLVDGRTKSDHDEVGHV